MIRELNTIQQIQKLNRVFSEDNVGPGNAHHLYTICDSDDPFKMCVRIQFQEGPRKERGSIHGVIDSDLLEIVRDRLKGFQSGEYATEYNAEALKHIEIALTYLNKRVVDRYERDVLGTNKK